MTAPRANPELPFLRGAVAPGLERRTMTLAPGASRPYRANEWRGALVVVDGGALELQWLDGRRERLGSGAVLWLAGLPLRALRSAGQGPVTVVALSRRA
jgi:hypothetical protein